MGVCDEIYQKVHGHYNLQFAWGIRSLFQKNEENVVFTKTKGPFSMNMKFKSRVLTRILKIRVKCCPPEKVGVLLHLSIETFQKVGVRNEKLE